MIRQFVSSHVRGKTAEQQALRHLEQKGLNLQTKNFNCLFGEIDLVMLDNDTLVFVEVRFRSASHFGSAAESVSSLKRKKCRTAARCYLQKHPHHQNRYCRFDVVAIDKINNGHHLEWIQNAF
ncbi:hypothetical protein CI610_01726 [invertebrate metagenome]|uniref:Uncharacterized protein n=1 Tax=invertebrate metagenome TaxID=1711999 RepID=A0A2H9T7X2_9ZZZZ